MAMKIPSGDNPFAVSSATPSVEGLVGYKYDGRAKAHYDAYAKQVEAWNLEQDKAVANDLINQIDAEDARLRYDPNEGYLSVKGKNAAQPEDGKPLYETYEQKRQEFFKSLNLDRYSPNVRKMVNEYNVAQTRVFRRGVNNHIIKQNEDYHQAIDQQNLNNLANKFLSDDPAVAREGFIGSVQFAANKAAKLGVQPDYAKTVGPMVGLRISKDLDADNVRGAKALLEGAKPYMSNAQVYKASHDIKVAEKRLQSRARGDAANKAYEQMFSDEKIAATAYEHATGKKMPEGLFETCLEIADGDAGKALEIAVVGVEKWAEEQDEYEDFGPVADRQLRSVEQRTAVGSAGRKFNELKAELGKTSVYDIANRLVEIDPELEPEEAMRQARKISKRRTDNIKMAQASQDQASNAAFATLNADPDMTFDGIPPSLAQGLSKETREGLRKFSDRRAAGSLVDDYVLRENLLENPEALKNMSDSQFLAMAGEFSPETFNELASFRGRLKANQVATTNKTELHQQVRRAFVAQNIKAEVTGKALQGLVVEMLVDAIGREMALGKEAKAWDDAQVSRYVGDFLNNSFTPNTWGLDTTRTFRAIASGNVAEFGSELEAILDKGLDSGQGIQEPSNLNRTKLMLEMLFFPKREVAGAQAMVNFISDKEAANGDSNLAKAIKEKLGPQYTHSRFLRAYLTARKDLITSSIIVKAK